MAVSSEDPSIPRQNRITCSHCGYRVPADQPSCPHCHSNPRQWRLKWSNAILLFVGALLLIYIGALVTRLLFFTMPPVARLDPTATLTRLPTLTLIGQVIIENATQTPITLPPTLPASATPTLTSRFTASPTRRGGLTTTPTLVSPTPKLADYAAPKLVAPPNATTFSDADANIVLAWEGVSNSGLRENEWYLISVSYTSLNGAITRTKWTRETRWQVAKEWWSDAAFNARTFSWNIQVMRIEGADPYASPNRTLASPPSETLKFIWQ